MATFGSYNPAQYMTRPGDAIASAGNRFANVAAAAPGLVREGQKWGDEMNKRKSDAEMANLIWERTQALVGEFGVTVPKPQPGQDPKEYGAYVALAAIAEAEAKGGPGARQYLEAKSAELGGGSAGGAQAQQAEGQSAQPGAGGGAMPMKTSFVDTVPPPRERRGLGSDFERSRKEFADTDVFAAQQGMSMAPRPKQPLYPDSGGNDYSEDIRNMELVNAMSRDDWNISPEQEGWGATLGPQAPASFDALSAQFAPAPPPQPEQPEQPAPPPAATPMTSQPQIAPTTAAPPSNYFDIADEQARVLDEQARWNQMRAAIPVVGGEYSPLAAKNRQDAAALRAAGRTSELTRSNTVADMNQKNTWAENAATTKEEYARRKQAVAELVSAHLNDYPITDTATGKTSKTFDVGAIIKNPYQFKSTSIPKPAVTVAGMNIGAGAKDDLNSALSLWERTQAETNSVIQRGVDLKSKLAIAEKSGDQAEVNNAKDAVSKWQDQLNNQGQSVLTIAEALDGKYGERINTTNAVTDVVRNMGETAALTGKSSAYIPESKRSVYDGAMQSTQQAKQAIQQAREDNKIVNGFNPPLWGKEDAAAKYARDATTNLPPARKVPLIRKIGEKAGLKGQALEDFTRKVATGG